MEVIQSNSLLNTNYRPILTSLNRIWSLSGIRKGPDGAVNKGSLSIVVCIMVRFSAGAFGDYSVCG